MWGALKSLDQKLAACLCALLQRTSKDDSLLSRGVAGGMVPCGSNVKNERFFYNAETLVRDSVGFFFFLAKRRKHSFFSFIASHYQRSATKTSVSRITYPCIFSIKYALLKNYVLMLRLKHALKFPRRRVEVLKSSFIQEP